MEQKRSRTTELRPIIFNVDYYWKLERFLFRICIIFSLFMMLNVFLVKSTPENTVHHLYLRCPADLFALRVQSGSVQVWRQNGYRDRMGKSVPARENLPTTQKSGADHLRLQVRLFYLHSTFYQLTLTVHASDYERPVRGPFMKVCHPPLSLRYLITSHDLSSENP